MTPRRRAAAIGLAAGLVGWSFTASHPIPGRRHPVLQAVLGTALAGLAGARLGLRGPAAVSGIRLGSAAAAVVAAGVAAGAAVPPVRAGMAARPLPGSTRKWLAWEIPLGTVWAEETAYRAALGTVCAAAFGASRGRALQAAAFGLSHVVDARDTGEPVAATVAVTGAAGWVLAVLAERSGSLWAPALVHLAINESGALAAVLVQRRGMRT
ncbi:Rv0804 family intramembrane glutamic endopeptidase [Mycolicibacterium palauense]|uniref:Rv0804 family intramembrane glutamic endopeptidase n=1 Tax=Mycolicibacterium palauense TaxID=2034511 RepID=UPI000BFED2D6|nr:CPBP family intramembrane glutamic endopeptidase [Mycolicibacterium palauense]